jgi:hypothetical protein
MKPEQPGRIALTDAGQVRFGRVGLRATLRTDADNRMIRSPAVHGLWSTWVHDHDARTRVFGTIGRIILEGIFEDPRAAPYRVW